MKLAIAAAAAIALSFAIPAQAASSVNCQAYGKLAEIVMTERQSGAVMHEYVASVKATMDSGKLTKDGGAVMLALIGDAYKIEAYPFFPELQRAEVVEFSNKAASWCYSEFGM